MNLERSIGNLEKKLDRVDPVVGTRNRTGLSSWKGRQIIPLDKWIELRDTPYALNYFPDDFDQILTYTPENELEKGKGREDVKKWNSDFIELMEHTRNSNYGKMKCFHCLLSPAGDDPIFIGINKLVVKGLGNGKQDPQQYPCKVVNRFQCPYERVPNDKDQQFDTHDLFALQKMAFAVEISLAKARKEGSRIRVRDKEELLYVLKDKEMFAKILKQGAEAPEVGEYIRTYLVENRDNILDHFMKTKDIVNIEELRFY